VAFVLSTEDGTAELVIADGPVISTEERKLTFGCFYRQPGPYRDLTWR
jgi:hypothetical protein